MLVFTQKKNMAKQKTGVTWHVQPPVGRGSSSKQMLHVGNRPATAAATRAVCRWLTALSTDGQLRLWWWSWELLLFMDSPCKLCPLSSLRENVQRTQVQGVKIRSESLEAGEPAGEVFLQPGHRFIGRVGSPAAPILVPCLSFPFAWSSRTALGWCSSNALRSQFSSLHAHHRRKAVQLRRFLTSSPSRLSPSGSHEVFLWISPSTCWYWQCSGLCAAFGGPIQASWWEDRIWTREFVEMWDPTQNAFSTSESPSNDVKQCS